MGFILAKSEELAFRFIRSPKDKRSHAIPIAAGNVAKRVKAESGTSVRQIASQHVTRLWARDEVRRLIKQRRQPAAAELAGKSQLVTPVSGAVVLENLTQFTEHGLTPVDPQTVPSVPEPGTWALLGLGAAVLGRRAWRRRKPAGHS